MNESTDTVILYAAELQIHQATLVSKSKGELEVFVRIDQLFWAF